jgi:acetolactate decarboxylase
VFRLRAHLRHAAQATPCRSAQVPGHAGQPPEYAKTLNGPGSHVHFVSADRTSGGHLLPCRGAHLRLQIQREGDYRIALPDPEDFLTADLRRDLAAALAKAEGEKT